MNSSSLSSLICGAWFSSSSEESITGAFRRLAAARVDLRGETADIAAIIASATFEVCCSRNVVRCLPRIGLGLPQT